MTSCFTHLPAGFTDTAVHIPLINAVTVPRTAVVEAHIVTVATKLYTVG